MSIRQLQREARPAGAGEFRVAVDGVSLRVRIDGTAGKPWLIFSNSLMTSLEIWDEQVGDLAASFRILRYDQRGHGGSEVSRQPADFDRLADDVIELMDAFGIASATVSG